MEKNVEKLEKKINIRDDKRRKKEALGIRVLTACRNEWYASYPYLDGAFASLPCEAFEEVQGIGTDGIHIFLQPDYLLNKYIQNPAAVRNGYLHMLLHCLYLHPFQEKSRDQRLWNLACDMAVEQIVDKVNQSHKWQNKNEDTRQKCLASLRNRACSAERIYEYLETGIFPYSMEEMETAFSFDDHSIWEQEKHIRDNLKKKWADILLYTTRGKEAHKHRIGTNKGTKKEDMEAVTKSRYDYREFLKQFAFPREELELDTDSFDYIFYHLGMEIYGDMPLIEPLEYKEVNRLEELVIAIDTSGSCTKEVVQRFLEETYSIVSTRENFFKKMKVYLIQCDCFIQTVKVIHSEEEWKEYSRNIQIEGRSGTDFRPVFAYIQKLRDKKELQNLKALIYFTDGDGIYPREKPDYETAFVFLEKTDSMNLVPPWALRLIVN